jgi:hypothetical protein
MPAEQLQYDKTAWQACRNRLTKEGILMSLHSNSQRNADDVAAIAAALNYPQIDSYGAPRTARCWHGTVRETACLPSARALILDSVVPNA